MHRYYSLQKNISVILNKIDALAINWNKVKALFKIYFEIQK